jgi:hypothetical protein
MLDKYIQPSLTFRDMHKTAHLIGSFSKGLDVDGLQKVASDQSFIFHARNIKPEKGYGFVHLITTGAGEVYGPNNNADYFNKEARVVEFPNAKGPKTMTLAGGLKGYHNTFTKYANVYREHFNGKKGGTPLGDVVMEAYNDDMNRGELIVRLSEDKWGKELEKLASDSGNVFWSMGAGVPFDICSECGNKARVSKDYCDHVKYGKLQLTKEGNQIFMYNDQPHFHDISCVGTPADRIAFGLSKVASENADAFVVDHEYNKGLYIPHSLIDKLAGEEIGKRSRMLEKLADIEKRIQLEPTCEDVKVLSDSFSDELDPDTVKGLCNYPLEDVLGRCNEKGILLPPESFIRIVLKKPEGDIQGLEGMNEALPSIFGQLKEEGTEALEDGSYTPKELRHWSGLDELIGSLVNGYSLDDEPLNQRVIKVTVAGPKEKEASQRSLTSGPSADSTYLAKEYAKYELSFLSRRDKYAKLVAVHNTN